MCPTVSELGEKKLLQDVILPNFDYKRKPGLGDDAAVIEIPDGWDLVVSCDKIPEDLLSVQLGLMDPFHHGRYLAVVNISDVAAVGGTPIALLATFALPNDFSVDYLREFCRGFAAGAREYNASVVGGDTGWCSAVCLSATSIGIIERGKGLTRSGAQENDCVFVTGTIGGFGTALLYYIVARPRGFALPSEDEEFLLDRLIRPRARVTLGRALALSGSCSACMDITDGVGRSMFELAAASQKSFLISEDLLPVHPASYKVAEFLEMTIEDVVFGIGLDLELLGTVAPDSALLKPNGGITPVGVVRPLEEGSQVKKRDGNRIPIPSRGWQHFSKKALDLVIDSAGRA